MTWFSDLSMFDLMWTGVGFAGQALFSARFIYQWIMSERARRSVVPEAFWYFSFSGGVVLLAYAVHKHDPVFVVGQGSGLAIYGRNIWMIWAEKRRDVGAVRGVATP